MLTRFVVAAGKLQKTVKSGTSAGGNISLEMVEAARGFDDDAHAEPFVLEDAITPYKTPALGVTFHYNEVAAQKSLSLIKSFLKHHADK